MISNNQPRVTIGIPVYNGQRYLALTLDSLLNQTFADFEIIISDNASTDGTQAICERYAAQDHRIYYCRATENRGPGWNYQRVFELATGKYFKWHAYDDLLEPDFLEKCVDVLDRDSRVVLAHCHAAKVDDQGHVHDVNTLYRPTDSPRSATRWRAILMQGNYVGCEIFGLMRMDVLRKAPIMGSYAHGDLVFIACLSQFGRFEQIPEALFFYRIHGEQSMQTPLEHQTRKKFSLPFRGPLPATEWWDPTRKGKPDFPTWRLYWVLARFLQRHPMGLRDRLHCYLALLERLILGKDLLRLGVDILLALETALTPKLQPIARSAPDKREAAKML
ncbi:glycosyltransferase family 2 protein [Alkalinema pantanalense CENA528]|uniref:glycosyltransferase family 2 protein n=1 Tax=Alkalinema pantanalense TaxID=1620705 RepID=UPI003D6ECD38